MRVRGLAVLLKMRKERTMYGLTVLCVNEGQVDQDERKDWNKCPACLYNCSRVQRQTVQQQTPVVITYGDSGTVVGYEEEMRAWKESRGISYKKHLQIETAADYIAWQKILTCCSNSKAWIENSGISSCHVSCMNLTEVLP